MRPGARELASAAVAHLWPADGGDADQERLDAPPLTTAELLAAAEAARPDAPGTWRYSNFAYGIVGAALERVAGAPFAALLRERLLAPLGMAATTPSPPPGLVPSRAPLIDFGACAPAGQLYSTLRDVLAWGACLAGEVPAVLPPELHSELVSAQVAADGAMQALAVQLRGRRLYTRGVVPGYACALVVEPGVGGAAAWRNENREPLAVVALAEALLSHPPAHAPPPPRSPAPRRA